MVEKRQEATEISLKQLRSKIDVIDQALLELLSERFEHAVKIAEIKSREGLMLYDPEREAQILKQLAVKLDDHESLMEIVSVFESMLMLSKKAQAKHLDKLTIDKKDLL